MHKDGGEWQLPALFLKDELQIDAWKNIPNPVVTASHAFKRAFENTCNIFKYMVQENLKKNICIV